ncbi:hypothetical protein [Gimesia algae]|uniref:Uncharacterized protein n=1 Tax=Gimesia algae TaxID=2527971 RepID=A0A517VML0_9PLAN|nr:hypothetical protein [Gimesia algae]QDT94259.1 hypothetical protein Pan161_59540 [Gimesia algae]
MTERFSNYQVTPSFKNSLEGMVAWYKRNFEKLPDQKHLKPEGVRPPIRYCTLQPYSTYIVKRYPSDSYDYDGDLRSNQEYAVMVDGDNPVPVAVMHLEPYGNHKQLVSFKGDIISGEIKLVLGGNETDPISLLSQNATSENITAALEKLPSIGRNNVAVTVYPGRWLIEFIGDLAGQSFEPFVVDRPEAAVFETHVLETRWNDSRRVEKLHYPIPLIGEWDGDDDAINDAVAAGSFGTANWFPGVGYMSNLNECRDFNGDGTPEL